MNTKEQEALDAIKAAMKGYDWRLEAVLTFGHGIAVQVYAKSRETNRYSKVGPLLFPQEGGTVADTLTMLGAMATEGDQ